MWPETIHHWWPVKVKSLSNINTALTLDHVENFGISEWHDTLKMTIFVLLIFKVANKDGIILAWPGLQSGSRI